MILPDWYARLAVDRPDLFRLIHDFNTRPQEWVRPEKLDPGPHGDLIGFLSTHPRGYRHASRHVTRLLELENAGLFWDFLDSHRRLALLSWPTLDRLASHLGAVVHASTICAMIGKGQAAELKSTIGPEAHAFALRRARTLHIPPAGLVTSVRADGPLGTRIVSSGWQWICALLAGEPESLIRRFALKVPATVEIAGGLVEPLPEPELAAAWGFVRRVGAEVLSAEERQCFD